MTSCKSEAVEQGSLDLVLVWDGQQVARARVLSTQPTADRLLRGLPAVRTAEVVKRLFGLCRAAQGAAARLAVQAARCRPMTSREQIDLALTVAREMIVEHLTHVLIAWPATGAAANGGRVTEFALWRQRLQAADDPAAAAEIAPDLERWLADLAWPTPPELHSADAVALLPRLSPAEWAAHALSNDFARWPTLAGVPAETGALARQAGEPEVAARLAAGQRIAARLIARRLELQRLVRALADPESLLDLCAATKIGEGCALACVETARGTLLHRVQLDGERVARYLIVAPTAWNFHPHGAFVREISGLPAASEALARQAGERLALALDPCVACTVRLEDA